jgi:hypothetical protein
MFWKLGWLRLATRKSPGLRSFRSVVISKDEDFFFYAKRTEAKPKPGGRGRLLTRSNVGALDGSPCAVAGGDHPDRLSGLVDFIDDPINVGRFAIQQVP